MNVIRKLYDLVLSYADKRSAPYVLGAVSFTESSFFPVPPDVLLMPMCLAQPQKAMRYALICTITSVLGGIVGYLIGLLLYDTVGQWLIHSYGLAGQMDAFRAAYQTHGHWIILIKGFTPIPYKLVTIASGLAGYDIVMFILLSIITRGARFFMVAVVMHRYGEFLKGFIEKHLVVLAIAFVIIFVGGIWASKTFF